MKTLWITCFVLASVSVVDVGRAQDHPAGGAQASAPTSGKAYFWMRMWPDYLVKYDPETDQVVTKIQTRHGVSHGTYLSHDRKKFMMLTGQRSVVEVLDIESGQIVAEHDFKDGGFIIRVSTIREIPGGTHWYVRIDRIKDNLDHYEILKPEWLLYDIVGQQVEKTMAELPRAIRSGARISPDGTKWHVFGRDITIVDPKTLREEGKVDLSKPLYTGMGTLSIRGTDLFQRRNPDAYRLVYTMRDPVKTARSSFGLVEIDMKKRVIAELREWGFSPGVRSFRLTRDASIGFAQRWSRGRGSGGGQEVTLLAYDMTNGKKLVENTSTVRTGLSLAAVSPDGKKAYLTGRGHELVIFDEKLEYLKTVELDGELDGQIFVVEQ